MRKILLLSAAAGVLFIGSIFIGIAAATTGSPVLYDARTPQARATPSVEGYDVEAGARDGDAGAPDASDGADEADASDDAPVPAPSEPGTPSPTPPSSADPGIVPDAMPTREEQRAWLAFQHVVRECMADAGHEYRYWEWWKTDARDPDAMAPAMPTGLTAEAAAAWERAFSGTAGTGDDVAWEHAGCWGVAMHATGDQQRSMAPDAPPADLPRSTTPPTPTPAP